MSNVGFLFQRVGTFGKYTSFQRICTSIVRGMYSIVSDVYSMPHFEPFALFCIIIRYCLRENHPKHHKWGLISVSRGSTCVKVVGVQRPLHSKRCAMIRSSVPHFRGYLLRLVVLCTPYSVIYTSFICMMYSISSNLYCIFPTLYIIHRE